MAPFQRGHWCAISSGRPFGGFGGFLIQVFEEDEVAGFKLSASEKPTGHGRIYLCVCARNLHAPTAGSTANGENVVDVAQFMAEGYFRYFRYFTVSSL